MKGLRFFAKAGAALALVLFAFTGCESTDGGGSSHTSMYYGVGFYDGWYHGHYDDDVDVIVTPPRNPRPSHPIARPPSNIGSRPSTMPSIPSAPRVSARGGGGRR
jgi:hypothetical protein